MNIYFFLSKQSRCYKSFLLSTIIALVTSTTTTFAVPITFQLEGEIIKADSPLSDVFYLGKPFSLTFTYDSLAPVTTVLDLGDFEYGNAIEEMTVSTDGYTYFANNGSIQNYFAEMEQTFDGFSKGGLLGPSVNGFAATSVTFSWTLSRYFHYWSYIEETDDNSSGRGPLIYPRYVADISPLDVCDLCRYYDAEGNVIYDVTNSSLHPPDFDFGQPLYNGSGRPIATTDNNGAVYLHFNNAEGQRSTIQGRLSSIRVLTNPIDNALVAYWPLHDGRGTTAYDYSGNQHNGSIHNGPVWKDDILYFHGDDEYIDAGFLDVAGEALTLTAWVKSEDFANCRYNGCRIITKSAHTSNPAQYWMISTVLINNETHLRFSLKTNGETSHLYATGDILKENEWMHIAAVYDGTMMYLYKNGKEVGRLPKTGNIDTNNTIPLWIGGNAYYTNTRPWKGNIANVRIFQKALTTDEVKVIRDSDRVSFR